MKKPATIDDYIAQFPKETQVLLEKLRATIRRAAPKATEAISYGLATYKLNGNLVHFGAFKKHIGFYPAPSGVKEFKDELAKYAGAKGSIQFPLDKPLPLTLITKMVKFRVRENTGKGKS